jgi:glycosyltransferase involved in cell wall biosynthesis
VYIEKRDFSDDIAKLSDVVICGNELLEKHYRIYNNNVIVLPTVENTNLFKPYWKDTFSNKTIGWIGSLTTINNLDLIVDTINKVVNVHPEVNFLIISNTALDYDKKIKNCQLVKWNKETYISELSNITIGIMPLKYTEFNQGKCGFKLIQYLNLKKPVIASDVGVNKKIVEAFGVIADKEQEWFDAIENLLMDEEKYRSFEKNIENSFFDKFSYEKNLNTLSALFEM